MSASQHPHGAHQRADIERVRAALLQMPELLECFHLTGEFAYQPKVVVHTAKSMNVSWWTG